MSENTNVQETAESNISFSSSQTQRELRIKKLEELKALGHNPFSVTSKRDFTLGFIKFWFDFVHKFDLTKITEEGDDLYSLDYFLHQVVFPRSLLEKMEDKLHLRYTVRQMGLDPDKDSTDFEDEFDQELITLAQALLPGLGKLNDDQRYKLLRDYLPYKSEGAEDFEEDSEEEFQINLKPNQVVTLAGRIKSKRVSGKIAFGTIEDESCTEGFQFIFKKDDLPEIGLPQTSLTFENFKDLIDEGDYIQATGRLDYSLRGEPSLFVTEYRILTKALRALPEKLEYSNFESRYLDRVADFKSNTTDENGVSVRDLIRAKAKYWQIWREEMLAEGFLEVECPVFEETPGGADARPFTTFYNELDQEMYLRISLELPLKKLIAGGFEKVFEIGRIFRNEGASPHHLQEYTQIEWYWAYTDYNDAMYFISKVYRRIASEIIGGLIQTDYYGKQINWGDWCSEADAKKNNWKLVNGWPAIKYFDAIRYYSKNFYEKGEVDLENKTVDELLQIAKDHSIEVEPGIGYGNLLDKIYKKVCRPFIQDPIFLYHQPVELEPLAKRDPEDPRFVHRWQVLVGTAELGKAFSELNDPLDQYERFEEQQKARDNGDEEAQFMDDKYVKALELGLPPLSGFGVSERMVSLLLGKNIKETVTFPAIRTTETAMGKAKKTMVAHAVLLNSDEVPLWSKLNAAAHLSASFGAREGKKLIYLDHTKTSDHESIPMNIQHAILMKQTKKALDILNLKRLAESQDLEVTVFTEEMRSSSNDDEVKTLQEKKTAEQIGWLGVLIFGEKKTVEKLTKDFELFE